MLILASNQQPYDDARGQKAGADGQLTKPWDTNAMMDKVRELLRRGAGAAPRPRACLRRRRRAGRARSAASLPTAAIDDDEYGEISIDTGRESVPTIPRVHRGAAGAGLAVPGGRISSPSMPAVPIPRPPLAAARRRAARRRACGRR